MGTTSPEELTPAALRMRDAIERRLFAAPPPRRRSGALLLLAAVALALLACALTLR